MDIFSYIPLLEKLTKTAEQFLYVYFYWMTVLVKNVDPGVFLNVLQKVGVEVPYPGIDHTQYTGPYPPPKSLIRQHKYYQWVSFFLFFQVCTQQSSAFARMQIFSAELTFYYVTWRWRRRRGRQPRRWRRGGGGSSAGGGGGGGGGGGCAPLLLSARRRRRRARGQQRPLQSVISLISMRQHAIHCW